MFYDRLNLTVYSTGKSRWSKDAAGMIVKCAEASCLRKAFPSQLSGLYHSIEMEHNSDPPQPKVRESNLAEQPDVPPVEGGTVAPVLGLESSDTEDPWKKPEDCDPVGDVKKAVDRARENTGMGPTPEEAPEQFGKATGSDLFDKSPTEPNYD